MGFLVRTETASPATVNLTSSDDTKLIVFTGTGTHTVNVQAQATASVDAGFVCSVIPVGGTVNIDPAGSVLLNNGTATRNVFTDRYATIINPDGGDNEWRLVSHYQSRNAMGITGNVNNSGFSFLDIGAAEFEVETPAAGSSFTPNVANNSAFHYTANANATIENPTNEAASGEMSQLMLFLEQDGTGSRTWTFESSFIPAGGSAPTLSTDPGDIDIVAAATFDGGTQWFYWLVGSFAS